jgi:4-hydroxy-3-polyprenylbenzoate decarboxylase
VHPDAPLENRTVVHRDAPYIIGSYGKGREMAGEFFAKNLVLGITGASGAVYAARLLEVLATAGHTVHLSISPAGCEVLRHELGLAVDLHRFRPHDLLAAGVRLRDPAEDSSACLDRVDALAARVVYHHHGDWMAPIASGSFLTDGMVICPCSGGTLSGVVHGGSANLIQRAADVHLKERRTLVLVPRETPLSIVQIDNLRRAAEAGAVVLPAMPGFYHAPTSIADLVDFVVARVCDQLHVPHRLMRRWGE